MTADRSRRALTVMALLGVVAFALLLRLWGVTFGFPFIYHYDDPHRST